MRISHILALLWFGLAGDGQLLASKSSIPLAPVPLIPLSRPQVDTNPKIVRVKIFPHETHAKPHRIDVVRTKIKFQGSSACEVFAGKKDAAEKLPQLLYKATSFVIDGAKHKLPVYIDCPSPHRIVRFGDAPSFAYRGGFYVQRKAGTPADIEIINVVDVDDYLKGVVPSEVYSAWPMESLKAQAVASRSYALYHAKMARASKKDQLYDFDDTVVYQAYTGIELENERTSHAVDATNAEVLLYGDNIIQAYYHADSGGATESPEQVWHSSIPYCQSQTEPAFPAEQVASSVWTKQIEINSLERLLKQTKHLKPKQHIAKLLVTPFGKTKTGRVKTVTAVASDGSRIPFSSKLLRKVIPSLPSYLFEIAPSKNMKSIEIVGKGSGHGVGLSQQGASRLAGNLGWSYEKILSFYYNDVTLCSLAKSGKPLASCSDTINVGLAH
ncbi:MAG: SpoIID/LytB domain-containing protein [Oligoflexales bacterium]